MANNRRRSDMSYPGACEKCEGDTGQDRIDLLVKELADKDKRIAELEGEIELITAPPEATGGVVVARGKKIEILEAENEKLKKVVEAVRDVKEKSYLERGKVTVPGTQWMAVNVALATCEAALKGGE
jgi:hypothetical protein